MAVERAFIVKLIADTKELTAGFNAVADDAEKAFSGVGNSVEKGLVPGFEKLAAVSAVAFAGLTAAAGLSIKAAIDAQAEQTRLAAILTTTGGATQEQVQALIAQAEALEQVGVASAGNIITAQSQLATFDLQFETIQRLTPAITDYVIAEKGATASAEDFKSMTNALAQALQGNFGALTKSGFVLDENTKNLIKNGTEAERSAALVDVLNSTYEGFNETARQTTEGRLVALRNSFDSVRQSIGEALLPFFEQLIGVLQKFAEFLKDNTGFVVVLGTAIAVFSGIIISASLAFKVYAGAATLAAAANTAFGLSLSATGIGAIIVVIGLIISAFIIAMQKSEGFRNAVFGVINGIIAFFETAINAFIGVFNFFKQQIASLGPILRLVGIDVSELRKTGEVSLGRLGDAAGRAAREVNNIGIQADLAAARLAAANLGTGLVSLSQAQEKVASTTARVNELRAQALKGGTSIEALNQAIKDQSAAQGVLNAILGDSAKKTAGASKAKQEAKKPLEEYTKVLKAAQGASDSYERSTRRLRDAKKGLEKADADLVAAQEALTKAQQAGSPADIADAQRAVAAAERNLTRGKFAGEQATFAVRDAEAKLAKVRADSESTVQDVREAEIALEEAKLRVKDQEDEQINTARSLETARRNLRIATEGLRDGDKELIPLKDAVTRAEEAQIRAAEQHADAVKEQKQAIDEYREALEKLRIAIVKFPQVASKVGQDGLSTIIPGVPAPAATGAGANPAAATSQPAVIVNVTAGIGGNAYQVGKEIIEVLDQYTSVAGPLDTLMRVA